MTKQQVKTLDKEYRDLDTLSYDDESGLFEERDLLRQLEHEIEIEEQEKIN